MARRADPSLDSIATPAALVGMALLAMAVHLNQARPSTGTARVILTGSGSNHLSLLDGWLPLPAVAAASALALFCLSVLIRVHRKELVGAGALGRARRARGRDLRGLRGSFDPIRLLSRNRSADLPRARVRLGDHSRRALWLPPDEHLLVLGPTGSGKSSALAIPALLEWPGTLVVTDPKGELVRSTLAYRMSLGAAAVFAPLMEPSAHWNPVASIRSSEDALRVATFLMGRAPEREPPALARSRAPTPPRSARRRRRGATLTGSHPGDAPDGPRRGASRGGTASRGPAAGPRLFEWRRSHGDGRGSNPSRSVGRIRLGPGGGGDRGQRDFDPAGIATGELRTLYCVVAPHDAPVLRGLISALISCCWRSLFARPPEVPALFVLDEFTQLTNLPELPALVQLGRSQGVRMILMTQDLGSISAAYGADAAGALWSNCRTKLLLPGITELELLDRASRLAGTSTLHRRSDGWEREPVSSQPLLHPDDVRRLKPRQALLLRGGEQPAVIDQHRWLPQTAPLSYRRAAAGPAAEAPVPALGRPLGDWIDPDTSWSPGTSPLRWKQADVEP